MRGRVSRSISQIVEISKAWEARGKRGDANVITAQHADDFPAAV